MHRLLVIFLLCVSYVPESMARFPLYLKNIWVLYGPAFRGGRARIGHGFELSYDRYSRTCLHRSLYWGAAVGMERMPGSNGGILTARASLSPYHFSLSRSFGFATMMTLRACHSSTDQTGPWIYVRPEVGVQVIGYNSLITPKLSIQFGYDLHVHGRTEFAHERISNGIIMIQAGVAMNLQTLRSIKQRVVAPTSQE